MSIAKVVIESEMWKAVPGYEGYYQVSSTGRLFSVRSERLLRLQLKKRGSERQTDYHRIILNVGGVHSNFLVHRLVALAFIENPQNLPLINHKDGNGTNNNIQNLEWCTASENCLHAIRIGRVKKTPKGEIRHSKISPDDVRFIRANFPAFSAKELSIKFNIDKNYVRLICHRVTWKNLDKC